MEAFYKYIGDPMYPGSGPGAVDIFGHHFPLNEAVKVDAPKAVHEKIEGNSHFEKVDGRKKV